MAKELRRRQGMPVDLTRKILDRAYELQRQLFESGEVASELLHSAVGALTELATTLRVQGDTCAALEAAERARDIASLLTARAPHNARRQHDLAVSYERIGDIQMTDGRREQALESCRMNLAIMEKLAAVIQATSSGGADCRPVSERSHLRWRRPVEPRRRSPL